MFYTQVQAGNIYRQAESGYIPSHLEEILSLYSVGMAGVYVILKECHKALLTKNPLTSRINPVSNPSVSKSL
jgi:hypothetical protein